MSYDTTFMGWFDDKSYVLEDAFHVSRLLAKRNAGMSKLNATPGPCCLLSRYRTPVMAWLQREMMNRSHIQGHPIIDTSTNCRKTDLVSKAI